MYSGPDTLAGGFPHSEIRGSTIARISPRLIAACHVLHRLLAPRHPPNALNSLETNSIARTQYQTAPTAPSSPCQACSQHPNATHNSTLRYFNQIPDLPVNEQTNPRSFAASGSAVSIKQRNRHTRRPRAAKLQQISTARPRKWRRSGSNRRPPACKAGALPAELRPHTSRTNLSQVSIAATRLPWQCHGPLAKPATGLPPPPGDFPQLPRHLKEMGQGGLEPPTPRLSSVCSNQLSYWPPGLG